MDALFPIFCLGCEREGVWLCSDCQSAIRPLPLFLCPGCGRMSPGNGESVDAIAAAYNAAAAAAGAPTVAEIEKAAEVDPEQERRTLLESIAPMLEKAGFPWYRANVPGGKRLAEISIDEARALHTKVTAHLGGV